MKLIIDIPEEDYKGICHLKNEQLRMLPEEVAEILIRISNGTPLPKGHGDFFGWISVGEKLPIENETVIASTKYGVYPETRYTKEYGWEWAYEAGADYWKELEDVTAWMPLPQPYKAESEG